MTPRTPHSGGAEMIVVRDPFTGELLSEHPYATADDICNHFGTKKNTVSNKAREIRDMFKMGYYDGEFSTARMREDNPFSNMVMINGLIVDKGSLPPEVQEILPKEEK